MPVIRAQVLDPLSPKRREAVPLVRQGKLQAISIILKWIDYKFAWRIELLKQQGISL